MSEPTYRVELQHDPAEIKPCQWAARIYRVADDVQVASTQWGETREASFDAAQEIVRRMAVPPEDPSTVYLTEDGDILDPHEVAR